MSGHYLDLQFQDAPSGPYLETGNYQILSADGTQLTVLAARASDDGTTVLLETDMQQTGAYKLASKSLGIGSVGFTGSSTKEPFLESVISLSTTQLLVSFSERMDRALAETAAFYAVTGPGSDPSTDVRVLSARLEDDEKSVVLTTTSQANQLYELSIANVKSRYDCDSGASANLLSPSQGKDVCSVSLRPVDDQGTPSRFTIRARTAIARSGATQPEAPGTNGTVMIGGSGLGANTTSCNGNPCSSGNGSSDEELIFDFDKPVRAASIVITQAQVGYGAVTAFLSSATSSSYDYTLSAAELTAASIGYTRGYHFAFCPSLPADLMVDSIKFRSAERKNCTASICLADGRRIDPTRRVANFTGIPTVDNTQPRLLSARSVGAKGVLLSFSEPLADRAADPVNFVVTPNLMVVGATLTLHRTQILLNTESQVPGQSYTLTAVNVNDRGGNALDPSSSTATFIGNADDLYVQSAVAQSNTQVLVSFNAPMDPLTTQDLRSYRIKDPDGSPDIDIAIVAVAPLPDGKSVLLTTTPQDNLRYELSLFNIKAQASDAFLDPTRSSVQFWGIPVQDSTPPAVVKAVVVGPTSIQVTFTEPLSNEATDPRNFEIVGTGAALSGQLEVLSASLTEYGSQVLLTTAPIESRLPYTLTVKNVRDRALNTIGSSGNTATFSAQPVGDASALPRVVGAVSTSNTKVIVRFSRPMNDDALLTTSYWIVQEVVNSEVGALLVVSARFVDGSREAVELTTRSQNELTYRITVSNVADITGKPLALPSINADPRTALFPGTAPGQADLVDTDGDGISDNLELRGWVVTVTLADGTVTTRQVTSDPGIVGLSAGTDENLLAADTDGDGLDDALERRIGSDPRSPDTDGDTLTDFDEYNLVFSNQNAVDTDGDGLDDAAEVEYYKTNALVKDSDGDGYTDDEELFERGRDPRIADLPSHTLSFGTLGLALDERYTYTDESGQTVSEESSTSTNLTVGNSLRSLSATGRVFAQQVLGEGGYGAGDAKESGAWFKLGASANFEQSASFESESVRQTEQAYASSLNKGREFSQNANVTREVVGATVSVDLTLKNTSDVAYTLSNLEVVMQVAALDDVTKLVSIATLVPERTLIGGAPEDLYLAPGQSRGPIRMVSRDVFPAVVQDLMRAPRAVSFHVSNYDVVAEDGRNFAFGMQAVREKTVGVMFDSGDGKVRQFQAITAAVLNRAREELRCGSYGDHADQLCTTSEQCGTSLPCQGGTVIGGHSNFAGTGRNVGIPIDFVLQDVLKLNRRRAQAAFAGPNGRADTLAAGDDLQLIARGVTGLEPNAQVIAVGPNGVLDSLIAGDDVNPSPPDGILVGPDRWVSSIAAGDDVQLIPAGTRGATEDAVAIAAGENGLLDTRVRGDDTTAVVTGYEVSTTCDSDTPFAVLVGSDGVRNTVASAPDVQAQVSAGPRAPVVLAGPSGFLNTIPHPNDVYLAPGVPCSHDADCSGGSAGAGRCAGPQKVVRFEARRDGQYRRFWQLMLPDSVQYQTDFGRLLVRSGDLLGLQFIQDIDRDGLDAQMEFSVGSSDFARDTDSDGLDDFVEVRVGWEVGVMGQPLRRVFPDPRRADSDGDGLNDLQESDFRVAQCACDATAPTTLAVCPVGQTCADQTVCTSNADCAGGSGVCRNVATCLDAYLAGEPCDPCGGADSVSLARTDPRRSDSDGDGVSDFEEIYGFLTGTSVADVGPSRVILAGTDLRADTLACPANVCSGGTKNRTGRDFHCMLDGDCEAGRRCVHPVFCDDVQVVPRGTGVLSARTVVVAPGPVGFRLGGVRTPAAGGDVSYTGFRGQKSETGAALSDVAVVGFNEASSFDPPGNETDFGCVDGSSFSGTGASRLPNRFPMCAVVKPGPDGRLESQLGGDDVLIPAGYGQRVEWTDPLNYDTDMDFASDGIERLLGSSPTDPSDIGLAGDRDRDGLPDNQESGGWLVSLDGGDPFPVFSNPSTPDTDGDGLPDYAERNLRCSQVPVVLCPTNPTNPDTDGDGVSDFDEVSRVELDRLAGFAPFFAAYYLDVGASKAYGTNPTQTDSDKDGLSDGEEVYDSRAIVLADGTTRSVFTSPSRADTDGDGLDDAAELLAGADPTDSDSDDDGRVDGEDRGGGLSPIVPDVRVTVHFERIEVEVVNDDVGDVGFWFLARSPTALARSGLTNPTLMVSANDVVCTGTQTPAANGCFKRHTHAQYPDTCIMLDTDNRQTIFFDKADQDTTFVVRKGEYFVIEGLIGEFDGVASPQGQKNTCGESPNYMPNHFKSDCYSRFSKVVNYSDLAQGNLGEVLSIDATDTTLYQGNSQTCNWSIISSIVAN